MRKNVFLKLISIILTVLTLSETFAVAPAAAESTDSVVLDFTKSENTRYVTALTGVSVSYSNEENAVMLNCTGSADPQVNINIGAMTTVSCDSLGYALIVYRTPTTNSDDAGQTELFFTAGSITAPTASAKSSFSPEKSHKYSYEIISLDSEAFPSGDLHSVRLDPFASPEKWDMFYLAAVAFCKDSTAAQSVGDSLLHCADGYLDGVSEEKLATAQYDLKIYNEPYWQGNIVYNESVFPLKNPDGTMSAQSLMYNIKKIVSVRCGSLQTEYKYGRDYTVENGKILIKTDGNIPTKEYTDYKRSAGGESWHQCKDLSYTYCVEGTYHHNTQIFITYVHEDPFAGNVPVSEIDTLHETYKKLSAKKKVTAVFFGDSITYGGNASGLSFAKTAPYMPIWPDMTVAGIREKYGYKGLMSVNTAVSGTSSAWGAETVKENVIDHTPDIVFVAFGMNDGTALVPPEQFKANIKSIIDSVRESLPSCEFVLISSILANPDTVYSGYQDRYPAVLSELSHEYSGVAFADITSIHKELLKTKKFCDMTGNNINHPNDFLIRCYSQALIEMLSPYDIEPYRAEKTEILKSLYDLSKYRDAEKAILEASLERNLAAIQSASTLAELNSIIDGAKNEIASLKTALQYETELLDYTRLEFGTDAAIATITKYNNTSAELYAPRYYNTAKITSLASDPYFRISYAGKGISADKYKYIALVYYVPESVTNTTKTELFFTAGSITGESQALSKSFFPEKGQFTYKILDMSENTYWTGDIHSLRLDTFNTYQQNDTFCLASIALFENAAEASAYAIRRAETIARETAGETRCVDFTSGKNQDSVISDTAVCKYGDLNHDGEITSIDANIMVSFIAGRRTEVSPLADINGDNNVTPIDSLYLKRLISGVDIINDIDFALAEVSFGETDGCLDITNRKYKNISVILDTGKMNIPDSLSKYVAVVLKSYGECEIKLSHPTDGDEHNGISIKDTTVQYKVFDMSDSADSIGIDNGMRLTSSGNKLSLYSLIFSDTYEAAESAAEDIVNGIS